MQQQAERVVIGMDPHKRSATIEVMTANEDVLGDGRFGTDETGFAAMTDDVNGVQPDRDRRVWAVEGCNGIGHHIAVRLLAAGEQVFDVPPKLSARTRFFATGRGRKTDATDAHSVALVGTRMAGLRPVVDDQQLTVLRVLADRRRSLGEDHTRMVSQLHQQLLELIPGGAKRDLSAAQAKALLAKVRPRDSAGKTSNEAMRALKRRLSDIVYRTMLDDAIGHTFSSSRTGPGGQRGNDSDSSATGSHPRTSSSDKSLPGPVTTNPRTPLPAAS